MEKEFDNIRSIELAGEGLGRISWAKNFMPALRTIKEEAVASGCLKGKKIGIILTLEPKTANLAIALQEAGADVYVFCSGSSTTDSVAAALASLGIKVFAREDADNEMDEVLLNRFLDQHIEYLIDDGAGGIRYIHAMRQDVLPYVKGAAEETTSGMRPLRVMERQGDLKFPCLAVNDAQTKHLFDNVYGTGQSVVSTLLDLTNIQMQGKNVVVVGYGFVGSGIAKCARAFGAKVTVTEVDPIRALTAMHDGYEVKTLDEMCPVADIFFTATGIGYSIVSDDMLKMKDGAILICGGAGRPEIDWDGCVTLELGENIRQDVREISMPNGKSVFLIADGECSNTSAREGNPIEIMDLSLAVQMSAMIILSENEGKLENRIYAISDEVDDKVARACLSAHGVHLDVPTKRQIDHANTWMHTRFI